jgi:hypothetical protein
MNRPLILALTNDGHPHGWLTWEDAVTSKVKGLIGWELGDPDTIYGGTSRMTGERSFVDVAPIISIKGKAKYRRAVPALTNETLAHRDKFICGYCSRLIRKQSDLTRDHIMPKSRGGKDVWMNVVLSCKHCNNAKDSKTPEEAGMPLIFLPYVPSREEELLLKNRNILYDQMDFISKFVKPESRILDYVKQVKEFDF